MTYLALKFSTTRGPIYERRFSTEDMFGQFVNGVISDLVKSGVLIEGQLLQSRIIPGYDSQPQFDLGVVGPVDALESWPQDSEWLALLLGNSETQDSPMRYFTLEVRTVPPEVKAFKQSFPLTTISSFGERIAASLVQLNLIRAGEHLEMSLYARSQTDGQVLQQESIHTLPEEWGTLPIRIEEPSPELTISEKPVPKCGCGHDSANDPGPLLILFKADVLSRLCDYVRRTGSRSQEAGGILIGEVHRVPDGEKLFVEIDDFMPAQQTEAKSASLRFTHKTWQDHRQRYDETKSVVGWYHTHPPMPINVSGTEVHTVQFFSREDHEVHRQIFDRPWQVALVMDAESNEMIFFRWEGQSLVQAGWHTVL